MNVVELSLLSFAAVICVALVISPLCNLLADAFVYRDDGHGRRLAEFHAAGHAAGLSYAQRRDELFLRERLVGLRRAASDALASSPDQSRWLDHLERSRRDSFDAISEERPDLLLPYQQAIAPLSFGHIFFEDEARLVDRLVANEVTIALPSECESAALRTVRPA